MKQKIGAFLEIIQPLCAAPMFFSIVASTPPLAVSWAIALLPWLAYTVLTGRPAKRTPFDIPIALFCLGLAVGFFVSPDKCVSGEAFSTTFAGVLIYYGLVNNAGRERQYWTVMSAAAGAVAVVLTVWFFSQGSVRVMDFNKWLFDLEGGLPKTTGPVLQFNNLGFFLALIAPVFFALGLFIKSRWRWLWLICGCAVSVSVVLSASGSGWGAAVVALVFVAAVWRWRSVFITVPVVAAMIAFAEFNYHRFAWITTVFSTESLKARIDVWVKTAALLEKSWFTGLGLGYWPDLFAGWPNVHNGYIQLYADNGLLGLAAFAAAAFVFVRISLRVLKVGGKGAWYGIFVGLTGGFLGGAAASVFEVALTGTFGTTVVHYIGIPLLWIMVAVFVVAERRLDRSAKSEILMSKSEKIRLT